jgi:hypothetical protein
LPTTDTLLLLKTRLEQNNAYYHDKPFKVLLDSLCGVKKSLAVI